MIELDDFNYESMLDTDRVVVIDFWAPWCAPCKVMLPVMEEIEGRYKDKIDFYKVNVDSCVNISGKYNIRSIPTILIIHKGEVLDMILGVTPLDMIEAKLKSIDELEV